MIEMVEYNPIWPEEFKAIGQELRAILGEQALAIHHIGSTSVADLAAKDVIDIQIAVASLNESLITDLVAAGFARVNATRDHCPPGRTLPDEELAKLMVNRPGRRSNIHIRATGKFNQAYPFLCRDYLRAHPGAAHAYAEVKKQLARYFPENIDAYYDVKDPVFDILMAGANDWAAAISWSRPPSDA